MRKTQDKLVGSLHVGKKVLILPPAGFDMIEFAWAFPGILPYPAFLLHYALEGD